MPLQAHAPIISIRVAVLGLLIAVIAAFGVTAVPSAAHAASASSVAELQAALSPGNDATITLTADAYDISRDVVVDRDVTIDLNGYVLMPNNLTVNASKTLTLLAGDGLRAVFVNVDGTLVLSANLALQPFATLNVSATGKVTSTSHAWTISGTQNLNNAGTITALVASDVVDYVTGNNYSVQFRGSWPDGSWSSAARVLAPTLAAAGQTFPPFTRPHALIASWNTEKSGVGTNLTVNTDLSTIDLPIFANVQWKANDVTSFDVSYVGAPDAAPAGTIALTATDTTLGNVGGDITDLVTFTSNNPADSIEAWELTRTLSAELAGTRVITGTLLNGATTVESSITAEITHSTEVDEMTLTITPETVTLGQSAQADLAATDRFGNTFDANLVGGTNCGGCDIVLSSSNADDVINQDTGVITFVNLGQRTITATMPREGEPLVSTAIVTVVPVPVVTPDPPVTPPGTAAPAAPLAKTGADSSLLPAASMLLILGVAAVLLGVRRRAS